MDLPSGGAAAWSQLALVLGANVAFGAGLFFHAFLYNFYLEGLGFGEGAMGIAQATLTAGGVTALLPTGFLVDRLGAARVVAVSTAVAVAGLVLTALAGSFAMILGASALTGAGAVGWRVAIAPWLLDLAGRHRERVFGWYVGLLVGSGGIWIGASGWIAEWTGGGIGGTRIGLLSGAAVSGAGAVVFLVLAQRARPLPRSTHRPAARSWHPGRAGIVVGAIAVWMVGPALMMPFLNLFFVRAHAWSVGQTGSLFAVAHLITALAVVGAGEIAQRRGGWRALLFWVLLFAPTVWSLGLVSVAGAAAVLYVLQSMVSPATNALIDPLLLARVPASRRGTVSAWRQAATEGSGVVGAAAGGLLLEARGFATLFGAAGVVGVIGGTAMLAAFRRRGSV